MKLKVNKRYKFSLTCSSQTFSRRLRNAWAIFAQQTSVHGVKHLVPNDYKNGDFKLSISTTRKIVWIILILISMSCFIAIVQETLSRYLDYPTYTNFYTKPKKEIEFPYVLICPTMQFHSYTFNRIGWVSSLYEELLRMNLRSSLPLLQYSNLSEVEADLLGLLKCYKTFLNTHNTTFKCYEEDSNLENVNCVCEKSQIGFCHTRSNSTELYELIKEMDLIINKTLNCTTFDQLMFDLRYKVDRTVFYCSYKNKPYWNNCARRFKPIQTYYGYCMIFNASDYFYENPSEDDKYVDAAGSEADLSFGMYLNSKNTFGDQRMDSIGIGVKIGLINPNYEDGHVIADTEILAPFGFTTNIAIQQKHITFLPKANKRRLQEECIEDKNSDTIKLKYFKTYNPKLCKIECLIERIYDKFKCKPYYAPKNAPGEYCSFLLRPILWKFTEDFERGKLNEISNNKKSCRHCPLLCTQAIYDIELSNLVYPSVYYFSSLRDLDVLNLKNETFEKFSRNRLFLNVFFKNMMIEIQEEKQEFTFISLLSSLGGSIGLFLGASFLSIFEFFEFIVSIIISRRSY